MKWSIGVTTCPRKGGLLGGVIEKIKANGWDAINVYAEPGSFVEPVDLVRVVNRDQVYGCWTNWICGLYDMYSIDIEAEAYAIFEDDVDMCLGLRTYLDYLVPKLARFGAVSLYTPSNQSRTSLGLNCIHNESFRAAGVWGTQAIVFSKESLARFLSSKTALEHRRTGYGTNNKNRDSALGMWAKQDGERLFCHNPSLVQHAGEESSVHHEYHKAEDFVGGDYDATLLLEKKIPIVLGPSEIYMI